MSCKSYEEFIDWAARAGFEGSGPTILTDEQAILLVNFREKHPDMLDKVEQKKEMYRQKAAEHRENRTPEYLQGLDKYNQIINDIMLTIEPFEHFPGDEKPLSYSVTDEQRQSLVELKYVGVEVDVRKDIGGIPIERVSNEQLEQEPTTK